jgi:choline dehydrogenase-like flavoprotein
LSENPHIQVLVLEAGGRDWDPWIRIPLAWAKLLQEGRHDWGYSTEPEPNMDGRIIECARGKVLGGSSSTNAMTHVRGNRRDYNRWSRCGLPLWDYAHILPYFKRAENWEGGKDAYRGDQGPLHVTLARFQDPILQAYRDAALSTGILETPDYNGAQQEGLGIPQQNIYKGRRVSASTAYLRPAMNRDNLTVQDKALATRVVFEGDRAVGITYERGRTRHEVLATCEVLLAGGAINTPQLLWLSGIGPADDLKMHGIPVRVDLPGVGKNLQDHIAAGVMFQRTTPSPFVQQMRYDRAAISVLMAYLFGRGPATQFPVGPMAFLKSNSECDVPDIQLLFGAGPLAAYPWFPLIRPPFPDGFGCRAVLLHPQSRGRLTFVSADPHRPPRIHQNFFARDKDLRVLRNGLQLVREIMNQHPLDDFRGPEVEPGINVNDPTSLNAYIRQSAITVHHPLGTCRMGSDNDAVVDAELKVRGTDCLRVVDASVMPDMVSGNINAAVVMIAEKASDIILGRKLQPSEKA